MSAAAQRHQPPAPTAEPVLPKGWLTDAELLAGDLENNIDKAGKAHRAQERRALQFQGNPKDY